jgi:hypothetical protein
VLLDNFRLNWETLDNESVERLLTAVVEEGRVEVLELFLAKDEGFETIDPKYRAGRISSYRWKAMGIEFCECLLEPAVREGHIELVKLLLAKDEDATTINPIDRTTGPSSYWYRLGSLDHAAVEHLLGIAVREGNIDIVKLFLAKGDGTERLARYNALCSEAVLSERLVDLAQSS